MHGNDLGISKLTRLHFKWVCTSFIQVRSVQRQGDIWTGYSGLHLGVGYRDNLVQQIADRHIGGYYEAATGQVLHLFSQFFFTELVYYTQVKLDDPFLDFLMDSSVMVELHMTPIESSECKTIGQAELKLAEVVHYPSNKLHGSVLIQGMQQ